MSKIGNTPVKVPKGVEVKVSEGLIKVKGPKGELTQDYDSSIKVEQQEDKIVFERSSEDRNTRSLHGLTRALVNNMVTGVSEGFTRSLELVGVGYRAEMQGKLLVLHVGYSHPILFRPPDEVKIEVIPKENKIIVTGIDKQLVGAMAAEIRAVRPPEPFKGKGVKYVGEHIRRKAGKAASTGAA